MLSCSAIKTSGKGEGKGEVCGCGLCLPKQLLRMLRPSFPGSSWTSAYWWEALKELLFLLWFLVQLLLFLFNCHYLDPQASLLSLYFVPILQKMGVSKRQGWCWQGSTHHTLWMGRQWACIYANTHTHLCMYKWIAVEFCLLNTGFAMVCHWYSMEQIISQIKKHRHENTFFSTWKKNNKNVYRPCFSAWKIHDLERVLVHIVVMRPRSTSLK